MKTKNNPFRPSILVNSLRHQGRLAITLSCGLAALHSGQSAFAASANWSGGSLTDANWTNTSNWSATPVPGTADTATFNAAIANTWGDAVGNPIVIDDVAGQSIRSITFTADAGSYFLGATDGNKLKLESAGAILINNALNNLASAVVTETINAPLELQGTAYTFTNNSANGTAAKAGILNFGGAISGGNAAVTVLTLNGSSTNANTVSGTISNGSSSSLGIIKSGAGTWVLTGSNTFSGPVSLQQGTLSVNSIADSGTSALGFGALNLGNLTTPGALTYTANAASTTSRAITLTGTTGGATINTPAFGTTLDSSTLTFNGTFTTGIGGAKSLTLAGGNAGLNTVSSLLANATDGSLLTVIKNGSGNWVLANANNSFTGIMAVQQGTLTVNSIKDGGTTSNIGAGTSIRFGNVANVGTLRYTGGTQSINRAIQIGNNSATPANTDTGGGTIQNEGSGALTFSRLPFNTPLNTETGVSANRVLTLRGANADANTISGIIQDNIVTSPATGTATIGVTKTDAGNWTLAGANTYSGATIVSGGTLTISGSRSVTAGAITVGGAAVTGVLNLQNTGTYSTGIITVGTAGSTSTVNQSAGTITTTNNGLIMGNGGTTTTSTYALSAGSLTSPIIMGVATASGTAHVTNFNLSGTGALTSTTLRIGRYDLANSLNSDNTFTQTGGNATVTNLGLGGNVADAASVIPIIATLNLTSGTFSATNFASLSAGGANTSTITIGGSAQVTLPAFPSAAAQTPPPRSPLTAEPSHRPLLAPPT